MVPQSSFHPRRIPDFERPDRHLVIRQIPQWQRFDTRAGQRVQFIIPAGTWQAGELLLGGRYALFGCTMAPGFTFECFSASPAEPLIARWPSRAADIRRLAAPS